MSDFIDEFVDGVELGGGGMGVELTPWQYEGLCRHALCREYGIPIDRIKTGFLKGVSGVARHQIDLYWTSQDGVCDFLCFANAKFLNGKVGLEDLMTLLGVQREIRAHKAVLMTNLGFTEPCLRVARENGVALLVVRPAEDLDPLPLPKAAGEARAVEEMEKWFYRRVTPAYRMGVVHRGFDLGVDRRKVDGGGESGGEGLPGLGGGDDSGASVGSGDDLGFLVETAVPDEGSIENAMMLGTDVMNRMMGNVDEPARKSPPRFGMRTK